jgi:hypothetical protein
VGLAVAECSSAVDVSTAVGDPVAGECGSSERVPTEILLACMVVSLVRCYGKMRQHSGTKRRTTRLASAASGSAEMAKQLASTGKSRQPPSDSVSGAKRGCSSSTSSLSERETKQANRGWSSGSSSTEIANHTLLWWPACSGEGYCSGIHNSPKRPNRGGEQRSAVACRKGGKSRVEVRPRRDGER